MMTRPAFEELNSRHQMSRAYFFGQKEFLRQFQIDLPIGLCAGLAQVWWSELQKGNDAIKCIQAATPSLIENVLLSQARSFYMKEFPPNNRCLRVWESDLLRFKYGDDSTLAIQSLYRLFGVDNALELDLVLLHHLPIVKRWEFGHRCEEIVDALTGWAGTGLYLLLIRFSQSRKASGEGGHRCALVIGPAEACRFYDPRWGEMSFSAIDQFALWFIDYWRTEGWEFFTQRGSPPSPAVRLFAFGGTFSSAAMEKSLILQSKFSASNAAIEESRLWLSGRPFLR